MSQQQANVFNDIIKSRHSVRGFQQQAVDNKLLTAIFTTAQQSPSNCNTQPWQVFVASGERTNNLRHQLSTAMMQGEMDMDFPFDGVYRDEYKLRQHEAAAQLYHAMGITREDKAKRGEAFMRNFAFFDAPHVAFLYLHQDFGIREAADLGMYAQSLMLSMQANGVGSCPMTALSFHADKVRAELDVPEQYKLLFGIAFGYEDPDHPANGCRVERAPLEQVVHFRD
ncbi:Nitroreductase NfnB [Sinobacterium norvegicum]|uniref:Nitroreductase NfnB n=1 Tax=Sinobacterium norvegicum TaxID=1641715 RepID=A0ABN8ELA1_9GAMM|nr:nitroreductase [Sinobacterium norvegicum]CAH0993107.1 Nitroreductase NfnB [Sinobacterium norvegicum]